MTLLAEINIKTLGRIPFCGGPFIRGWAYWAILFITLTVSIAAFSQDHFTYRLLIDTDNNSGSGCSYDIGSGGSPEYRNGFEQYLELTMLAPGELDQYGLSGSVVTCESAVWNFAMAGPLANSLWSATLNQEPNQADVIEAFIPRSALLSTQTIRVVLHSQNTNSDEIDTLESNNGAAITFSVIPSENIPSLPHAALVALFVALVLLTVKHKRLRIPATGMVLLMGLGGMPFIADVDGELNNHCALWGWCVAWDGVSPIATDPANDTPDTAIDIQALYMAKANNGDVAVRVDVNDVSNACLSLSPCDVNALCSNEAQVGYNCTCPAGLFGDGEQYCGSIRDDDGDGVDLFDDNCPEVANAEQIDTDQDGIGDLCDPTPNGDLVSISLIDELAIEKSQQAAQFSLQRSSGSAELTIAFSLNGSLDPVKGSASSDDYILVYADDGSAVGQTLTLPANQNLRIVQLQPIQDAHHEVPETLRVTLGEGAGYELSANETVSLLITDASNDSSNAKVFFGVFMPQDNAVTSGSGVLSLILDGDNENASLNYNFSNLSAEQTDQHIHLAPSGTILKDVHATGSVYDFSWDLAPGGIFVTEQAMLDALFNGEFYLNIHTANYPSGEISATMVYDAGVEPPAETVLTAADVDRDIIRFLTQATFGATPEQYTLLRDQIAPDGSNRLQVYSDWIDLQIATSPTRMYDLMEQSQLLFAFGDTPSAMYGTFQPGYYLRRDAFWPMAVNGKDQLRQRVAFALSQILVVADTQATIRKAHRGTAHYWDQLADNAFGFYNDALFDVSVHPIMGTWLSHLRNKKSDPIAGSYPDENYAREVMQLFSFGLVHREKNGNVLLGEDNLPMPTYDNEVIKNMARVFTGMAFSYYTLNGEKTSNTWFDRGDSSYQEQHRWTNPMKFFASWHDYDEKILFTDNDQTVTVPAVSATTASADSELRFVVDALVSHQTTAPNISRLLIQRFVTSNPSANYIERVANAFGSTGDLTATIKAILLDPEARNPSVINSMTFGKVKEPLLQLTATMRLLQAGSEISFDDSESPLYPLRDRYDEGASLMRIGNPNLGQYSLGSQSVFNFYLPDFSPAGVIASQSLVAPEMQLMTESQIFSTMNAYNKLVNENMYHPGSLNYSNYTADQLKVILKPTRLLAAWNSVSGSTTEKAEAMVDYLDFYLNAGQLKQAANTGARAALIQGVAAASSEANRLKDAVYGVNVTSEFLIQQ